MCHSCLEKVEKRFWKKVDINGLNECWEWTASRHPRGYGQFRFEQTTHRAHRIAFFFANGYHPKGKSVCHRCDNPPCCNPNHLFEGTQKDNMVDCVKKKRKKTLLSEKDVIEIRKKFISGHFTLKEIAGEYCISKSFASNIVRGERWAWLPGAQKIDEQKKRMKLSNAQVDEIRNLFSSGDCLRKEMSDIYNVDPSTISRIISNKSRRG